VAVAILMARLSLDRAAAEARLAAAGGRISEALKN
jgi:N-acetylmuramic acid 6-phosphate (MurNAc-6-P) etherase